MFFQLLPALSLGVEGFDLVQQGLLSPRLSILVIVNYVTSVFLSFLQCYPYFFDNLSYPFWFANICFLVYEFQISSLVVIPLEGPSAFKHVWYSYLLLGFH